ncbi:DUF3800 domain-containing protein [Chlorobium sp. KB01]|uniref:DUF3800 domain-containing protein n=1 Tax=Chlorobium sp. KB01 TaxID=1917528 RepID=UPI0009779B19|nr:DUF3800 domain-containing protein [Chlorobium sp. KB01]
MEGIPYSDYLVFVDESGDHGLVTPDKEFPVFALVFCIISKHDYLNFLVPTVQKLKLDIWGHDQVILHERDIRKESGIFATLRTNRALREEFLERLTQIIADAPIQLITSIIDKPKLLSKYATPFNPYELALRFCMERVLLYLSSQGESGKRLHVLLEARGKIEDAQLELEFRRICANQCDWYYKETDFQKMKFEPVFVPKASNSTGLQIADLVARPLALQYLRPAQANRTYEILKSKELKRKVFP